MAHWAVAGKQCVCVYNGNGKQRKQGAGRFDAAKYLVLKKVYTLASVTVDPHTGNIDVEIQGLPGVWNVQRFAPLQKTSQSTTKKAADPLAIFKKILDNPTAPVEPSPEKVKTPEKVE